MRTLHPTRHTPDCSSILPHPTTTLILRPTLDSSAILPYRTLSYILLQPTIGRMAEQSSVGRGRMYDRVVGWGRTG